MVPFEKRTPENCRWRNELLGGGQACGLVLAITGADDGSLSPVRPDECAACCRFSAPRTEQPNPLVASALYKALKTIQSRGGTPGCSAERAVELEPLALDNILVIPPAASGADSKHPGKGCAARGDR